jgi:transmembrane sensor
MTDTPPMSRADEEAAFWLFRHDLGLSAEDALEFAGWLDASSENAAAWAHSNATLDSIGIDDDPFLEAMRADALAARPRQSLASRMTRIAAAGVATMLVGTAGIVGWQAMNPAKPGGLPAEVVIASNAAPNYRTDDAVRTVTLPDGSEATLDRQTSVAILFVAQRRDLRVLRGGAIFDVRHDGRVFNVRGGDTTVTATGTRFAVQVLPGSVVATLERGGVIVRRDGDAQTVALVPGQRLVSATGKAMQVTKVDPPSVLPWTVPYVTFSDTPLDTAVAQMSARSKRRIRVIGTAARLLISGRFRADDPQGFVAAVIQALPVRQRVAKDGAIELVARR